MYVGDSMANIHSAISFGLVNIPIVYNPIVKNNDTSFNQLHKKCLHRIRYQKYCEHCKKTVTENELIKGYEYEKEKYVTFTKEELKNMQMDSKETIEIISFVPETEIEPFYYEKSYVLISPKKAKAYSLFLEVLKKSKKVAIAKTTIGSKFYYCVLRYFAGSILLSTIYYEEEINIPDTTLEMKFTKQEYDLAMQLVNQLNGHFTPEKYEDEYQKNIKEAINEKIDGHDIPKKAKKKKTSMKDLVTSLQKSLDVSS